MGERATVYSTKSDDELYLNEANAVHGRESKGQQPSTLVLPDG